MLEFLVYYNSLITHSVEGLAAITGLFCLKKYKGTAAIFFIWLLVYLFLIDVLGMFPKYYNTFDFLEPIKKSVFRGNNWWFTVFFDIIAVSFFAILYQKILQNQIFKSIIKYIALAYFIFALGLIFYNVDALFKSAYTILYVLQAIVILCCASLHFIEILKGDKILYFSTSLYFYISATIFLWWLVMTALVFFEKYYVLEDKNFVLLKRSIYIFSNIFMYSTFSIGLIVSQPEKK